MSYSLIDFVLSKLTKNEVDSKQFFQIVIVNVKFFFDTGNFVFAYIVFS